MEPKPKSPPKSRQLQTESRSSKCAVKKIWPHLVLWRTADGTGSHFRRQTVATEWWPKPLQTGSVIWAKPTRDSETANPSSISCCAQTERVISPLHTNVTQTLPFPLLHKRENSAAPLSFTVTLKSLFIWLNTASLFWVTLGWSPSDISVCWYYWPVSSYHRYNSICT